jgi:hypothetical protein
MRTFGVNYDTGLVVDGRSTRATFDERIVRRELQIVADDLHASAVRITGEDADRLEVAARHASAAGLQVWFSPFVYDLGPDELVAHLAGCAEGAERLRHDGADVVLVLGCEMSLFCSGFIPGDGLQGRVATLSDPATWMTADSREALAAGLARAKDTQRRFAADARSVFGGPITYAAGLWEDVEWDVFDIVSVDAYRDAGNAAGFGEQVRTYHRFGKPLAVTEFGCCTYRGASRRGGTGWMVIDEQTESIAGDLERDEAEPVSYFHELIDVFEDAGVDSAFWFSFAGYELPHRPDDPHHDLDLASYGLVAILDGECAKRYPDMPWEPKQAFDAVAARYGRGTRAPADVAGRAARPPSAQR